MKKGMGKAWWTAAAIMGGLLGVPLAGAAQSSSVAVTTSPVATAPAPAQGKDKVVYTNKPKFHLPVKIDDRIRTSLQEVCLFLKPPQGDWVRQESGPPSVTYFSYNPPQDGEYWFNIVTVDRTGKISPADIKSVAPALKVIVDTQPPVVDVFPWLAPDGDVCLRCNMKDANPDFPSLKITYKAADLTERILSRHPHHPAGTFAIPGREIWKGVKVSAADKCGNVVERTLVLKDPTITAAGPTLDPVPGSNSTSHRTASLSSFKNEGPGGVKTTKFEVPMPQAPALTNQGTGVVVPPPPPSEPTLPVIPAMPSGPQVPPTIPEPVMSAMDSLPSPIPGNVAAAEGAPRLLVNTTHAAIDYRIDPIGPSGVGKVEIYMTSDQGQTWRRLCEDADRRSPAEIDLPGEGKFGIRLVVTNGNGFGGTPPVKGDAPISWIEVDSSSPFVQLREVGPVVNSDGTLDVRWTASDRNLGTQAVTLYYTTNPSGPWQVMAQQLKNEGQYRWAFPRNLGGQFFFRIEVTDQAGNVARSESNQPLVLDMTEPRAIVVGITGAGPRSTTPLGN